MQIVAERLFEPAAEQLSTAVCAASERPADVKRLILAALIDAFLLGCEEMSRQGCSDAEQEQASEAVDGIG